VELAVPRLGKEGVWSGTETKRGTTWTIGETVQDRGKADCHKDFVRAFLEPRPIGKLPEKWEARLLTAFK
jgi:hypothetical protein